MTGCRISEEDARDSHFDGLSDAEERAIATREHMERRDTLKEWVHAAKEKVDKMLEYGEFAPDADDILQAEQLNSPSAIILCRCGRREFSYRGINTSLQSIYSGLMVSL